MLVIVVWITCHPVCIKARRVRSTLIDASHARKMLEMLMVQVGYFTLGHRLLGDIARRVRSTLIDTSHARKNVGNADGANGIFYLGSRLLEDTSSST